MACSPTAIDTPVWPLALIVTDPPAAALMTVYVLLEDGAVMTFVVVSVPVIFKMAYCAVVLPMLVPEASPLVLVSVTAPSPFRVNVPAIAMSEYCVMPLLTVSPHVPESSP